MRFIDPGKPIQNAYIESFNGKFRDECLSQYWFISLEEARSVSEDWRMDYNERRPHQSLQYKTPAEFAKGSSPYQTAELSFDYTSLGEEVISTVRKLRMYPKARD